MMNVSKEKRTVFTIGSVVCVEVDNQYKCFFQYVARDRSQLNSEVIRIFKRHYPMDYVPDMDEIVNDDVAFYTHTFIRVGYWEKAWYKVGRHKSIGATDAIRFKLHGKGWYIWSINGPYIHVELTEEQKKYEYGYVFPYTEVIYKIKHGEYEFEYCSRRRDIHG